MKQGMYQAEGACPDNEALTEQIQAGNDTAAAWLLSRNEGYLTSAAKGLCRQSGTPALMEDLKQEGALALIEAAKRYTTDSGTKFLTYAAGAVRAAMLDCLSRNTLPLVLPTGRYHQLRRIGFLCATATEDSSDAELIERIGREENVSEKTARTLLTEYRVMYGSISLDNIEVGGWGSDPARTYDLRMRRRLLAALIGTVLRPREQSIIRYHLGLGTPEGKGMTFAELAVYLNYNGPSAAEKAYKRAIQTLREHLGQGEYGAWMRAKRLLREAERELT